MKYERYLLIAIEWYEAKGGIKDVVKSVNNLDDAIIWFNEQIKNCLIVESPSMSYQIFDCDEREVIFNFSTEH